jgi:DNA-binding NarL/FixJ family response regulator
LHKLSDREFEVFELLGEGVSAHEIARRLHLSTKTVNAQRANINWVIKATSELFLTPHAEWSIALTENEAADAIDREIPYSPNRID